MRTCSRSAARSKRCSWLAATPQRRQHPERRCGDHEADAEARAELRESRPSLLDSRVYGSWGKRPQRRRWARDFWCGRLAAQWDLRWLHDDLWRGCLEMLHRAEHPRVDPRELGADQEDLRREVD